MVHVNTNSIKMCTIITIWTWFLYPAFGNPSVKAHFVDCRKSNHYNSKAIYSYKIENFPEGNKILTIEPSSIHLCVRKILIKIVFDNNNQSFGDDFITVNEVDDATLGKTTPLFSPIVVKMRKEQTQIIYPITAATGHCLKHSESWYSVCKLRKPVIIQETTLQILQKISDSNGVSWIDLTRGQVLRLGTSYRRAYDELPSIYLSYSLPLTDPCEKQSCPVDPKNNWLLFPTSETEEIMSECIFISKEDISLNGRHYDELSMTFDELFNTGGRCQQTTRTCLATQPLFLERSVNGTVKNYYLENLSLKPILPLPSASEVAGSDFIALEYTSPFQSFIDIDIRADSNALIRKGHDLEIQYIATDCTSPGRTLIESIVINTGFVEASIQPNLINCTAALPTNIFIKGPMTKISPMHRHVVLISMEGKVFIESMSCFVEFHNEEQVPIARTRAQFKRESRCICTSQTDCTCLDSTTKSEINSQLLEQYKYFQSIFAMDYFKFEPLNVFIITFTILLSLGKLKILFGICSSTIRNFGSNYLKNSFKCSKSRFTTTPSNDSVTFQRAGTDILLNMFFFVLFPIAIIKNKLFALWKNIAKHNNWISSISKNYSERQFLVKNKKKLRKEDKDLNLNLTKEKHYSLEDEDTQYVINALKKLKRSENSSDSQKRNSL